MLLFMLLALVHTLFWGGLLFGGVWSPRVAAFNVLYVIPATYLLHTLPLHVLIRAKMACIDPAALPDEAPTIDMPERDYAVFRRHLPPDTPREVVHRVFSEYKRHEHRLVIPKIYDACVDLFEDCFANPFSAQGLLILAGTVNAYAFFLSK